MGRRFLRTETPRFGLFLYQSDIIRMMLKINLKFLKRSKHWLKRVKAWAGKRPHWLKFAVSVFLISLLASLISVGIYDRYYGASPISNRGRLLKEALAACTQAQTLAQTAVNWENWPLESSYGLEGQALGEVMSSLESFSAYPSEEGPAPDEVALAVSWLKANYPDLFSVQEACTKLAEKYQQKYAY